MLVRDLVLRETISAGQNGVASAAGMYEKFAELRSTMSSRDELAVMRLFADYEVAKSHDNIEAAREIWAEIADRLASQHG